MGLTPVSGGCTPTVSQRVFLYPPESIWGDLFTPVTFTPVTLMPITFTPMRLQDVVSRLLRVSLVCSSSCPVAGQPWPVRLRVWKAFPCSWAGVPGETEDGSKFSETTQKMAGLSPTPSSYPEDLSSPAKLCSPLQAPSPMGKCKEQRIYPLRAPLGSFASTLRPLQTARGSRKRGSLSGAGCTATLGPFLI